MQDEQDKLLTLLDASAALASAAGAAAKLSDEDGVAGLRGGPRGVRRVAAAAARPEHFILSIAACKVHQERPDPRRATATLDQQRCVPLLLISSPLCKAAVHWPPYAARPHARDRETCEAAVLLWLLLWLVPC